MSTVTINPHKGFLLCLHYGRLSLWKAALIVNYEFGSSLNLCYYFRQSKIDALLLLGLLGEVVDVSWVYFLQLLISFRYMVTWLHMAGDEASQLLQFVLSEP